MLVESRLVGYRVVYLGCRVRQLIEPFESQTATLVGIVGRIDKGIEIVWLRDVCVCVCVLG